MKNLEEVKRMKIQGPNPYLNVYRTNQKPVKSNATKGSKDDQLNISNKALQLQQNKQMLLRNEKITEIKSLVQSGEYKVDHELTAEKLLEFWRS